MSSSLMVTNLQRSADRSHNNQNISIMNISHSNNPSCSFLLYFFLLLFHLLLLVSSCSGNSNVSVRCIEAERTDLLDFKDGLIDPYGRLSSWVGLECCNWQGVRCDNRTGGVTVLDLGKFSLGSKINPSLLHLENLIHLSLAQNSFCENEIPKFFGMLKNLRYLNLSYSCFAGEIPPHLGNLSALQILDLSLNSGLHAKNLLWLSSFHSLEYLDLGRVNLFYVGRHWSKAVNMLPSLVRLYLHECDLTSLDLTLPSVNLTLLKVLSLTENSIKSPLPLWFSNLTNLEELKLRENKFYGTIPGWLGNLCKLRILKLNSNRLSGGIVEFLERSSACQNNSLESLPLASNLLGGSLPVSLGALKNLQDLNPYNNHFWGSIPASIGNLSSLRYLELSRNHLNGTIPESFGKLTELSKLDLEANPIEGVLTEAHLANLTKLDTMILTTYRNRSVIFKVKDEWVPTFRLTTLVLINCQVGPSFPVWLQVQSNLSYVIISNAGISDTIEEKWFARLFSRCSHIDLSNNTIKAKLPTQIYSENRQIIDLSRNRFEGQIPFWSTNATQLYLQSNLFSSSIPENIGDLMPQLQVVFLSWNQISGKLPSSICKMKGLKFFSVRNNRFSGELPNCWNNLRQLKVLDASNNRLNGKIPSSLSSLCDLAVLILSNNNLRGNIPYPLCNCRKVPKLYILHLRSNLLDGNIPERLCRCSYIHVLDLSDNNFTGPIPKCFHNFTALKYGNASLHYKDLFYVNDSKITNKPIILFFSRNVIEQTILVGTKGRELEYSRTLLEVKNIDLSKNNLTGEFPDGICSLAFLDSLNLSRNHLSGSIPNNIGDLQRLESLDLSHNNFSGSIPPTLSSLTFLGHLKLSYNNLSGQIPTGNQLQTLNESSNYEGNPLLCGGPLPTRCPGDNSPSSTPSSRGNGGSKDKLWLYLSIGMGFAVGFWSVCGTLILKESWRHAYYRHVDDLMERILLWITLLAVRSRRMYGRGNN